MLLHQSYLLKPVATDGKVGNGSKLETPNRQKYIEDVTCGDTNFYFECSRDFSNFPKIFEHFSKISETF